MGDGEEREGAVIQQIHESGGADEQEEERGSGGAEDGDPRVTADETEGVLPWDE
jgi:hypothetical protein